jgi:hypothetical protein
VAGGRSRSTNSARPSYESWVRAQETPQRSIRSSTARGPATRLGAGTSSRNGSPWGGRAVLSRATSQDPAGAVDHRRTGHEGALSPVAAPAASARGGPPRIVTSAASRLRVALACGLRANFLPDGGGCDHVIAVVVDDDGLAYARSYGSSDERSCRLARDSALRYRTAARIHGRTRVTQQPDWRGQTRPTANGRPGARPALWESFGTWPVSGAVYLLLRRWFATIRSRGS